MERVPIPGTALEVSRLCLGVPDIGVRQSEGEAHTLLDAWLEAGGNFLDTARVYSDWVPGELNRSERILGDWMHARKCRDRVIVATKGAHPPLADMAHARCAPADLLEDVQGSLRTLRTDRVDLWYFHRDDPTRPVQELVTAADGLVRSGMIRAWAVSNWKPDRVEAACSYAASAQLHPPVAVQNHWNVGSADAAPLPAHMGMVAMDAHGEDFHRRYGMTAIPYSSQAGGFFSKWIEGGADERERLAHSSYATPGNIARAERIQQVARARGVPVSHVVLGYLRAQPFPVFPLVGCHRMEQIIDSVAAADCVLSAAEVSRIRGPGAEMDKTVLHP
jgi:aryl-alcohol dehydrogenase-like predicted oxidoreductase